MRPRLSMATPARVIACVLAVPAACLSSTGVVAADPATSTSAAVTARKRVIVDHAVAPAGGHHCGNHCGNAGCRIHHGHLAGCRDGHCAPHCPVRPSHYGFYGTQWRKWPGQGVVPVSAEDVATPVAPPPSQVPGADEESPQSPADAPAAETVPEESTVPVTPAPAEEPPTTPEPPEVDARPLDQSALPVPEQKPSVDVPGMRYPALTGRLLATDDVPRRLPQPAQRAGDSARGL